MYWNRKPYFEQGTPNEGGGGGTPPAAGAGAAAAPDAATVEAEGKELLELSGKEATTLTDAEKTRLTELSGKYETVYKDDKGNPLTKEQIDAHKALETKVAALVAKDPATLTAEEKKFLADNTLEDDDGDVYAKVDELRGSAVEVDYGDVAPTSAEGIILREQRIAEIAQDEYEAQIKAKFPRAYQLMAHLNAGGREEDFFKPENQDFKKLTVTEADKSGQERVLRLALAAKGNSPDIINAVITSFKDGGQLFAQAKSELEALQAKQDQTEQARITRSNQLKQQEDAAWDNLSQGISTALEKGFDGVVVPPKDRKDFGQFLSSRIDYRNGKFLSIKEFNAKELAKELKVAYFEFKGGDIKGLAEREAKTIKALKLKSAIKQEIVPKGTGAGGKRLIKLSEI